MKKIWLVTGVSGCGWNELLDEISKKAVTNCPDNTIYIFDVGNYMQKECERLNFSISKENILDVDGTLLETIRSLALKEVLAEIKAISDEKAIIFIGIHAVFHWKNRLIPGVSYYDLGDPALNLAGVINVTDDITAVLTKNDCNPVRKKAGQLSPTETQKWMQEEELLSKIIADIKQCPFYVIAKNHNPENLLDFFLGQKKRIYLSYPITAIRNDDPSKLDVFLNTTLRTLNELFVVFNPLAIGDLGNIASFENNDEYSKITNIVNTRTIQRDFRFIDQSNAVVVYYDTDKNSPGVFAEIYYAYRTGKPVYIYYPHKASPFLQDAVTSMDDNFDSFVARLRRIAQDIE